MLAAETLAHCQQMLEDAGAAFALLTRDGRVTHCNESFARLYGKAGAAGLTGRTLADFLPRGAAEERAAYVVMAVDQARPVVVEELWNGVQLTVTVRPQVPCEKLPEGGASFVARSAEGLAGPGPLEHDGGSVIRATARQTDLGPLAKLTPRELEIMALIGEGMTNSDIARRIHRSDKTVEWHRSQLGVKLGVDKRVELARLAHRAGLIERVNSRPSEFGTAPHADGPDGANGANGADGTGGGPRKRRPRRGHPPHA